MTAGGAFAFKGEWRPHPGAVARCFRDIVRRWRTGHWRGGMAMTRHHYRLTHRRLDFDRLDRRGFDNRGVNNRCFNCGFRRRRDGFHWRFNDRRRFHHFRFYHHRLGVLACVAPF